MLHLLRPKGLKYIMQVSTIPICQKGRYLTARTQYDSFSFKNMRLIKSSYNSIQKFCFKHEFTLIYHSLKISTFPFYGFHYSVLLKL